MGLLLSVLIGCVGVLELLACLRDATNGVPLVIEYSAPCLFYHHFDSIKFSSDNCTSSISPSSQPSFPINIKHKLENLHEYRLRIQNDLLSIGGRYEITLSDSSTRDLLSVYRPESRLSDDFETKIFRCVEVEETSDAETKSGFTVWNTGLFPSELNSNLGISPPISCSLKEDVEGSSDNDSENQNQTNLPLDMHFVKKVDNSIEIMSDDENTFKDSDDKMYLFNITNSRKSKRHRDKEIGKSDVLIPTKKVLSENKYFNPAELLSQRKKSFPSVQVQTSLEETMPNGNSPHSSRDSCSNVKSERKINKLFNSTQSLDEYVDAEDEKMMIMEYQVNSPIKYAVPDTGKSHAFWVIL